VIALIGRALLDLLCAMTAPRPPVPDLPPVQPRPEPPPGVDLCIECKEDPRAGGPFCGQRCQAAWTARTNRAIPLPATPPTLPDGSHYRRTT
jgi:hypothetical protein